MLLGLTDEWLPFLPAGNISLEVDALVMAFLAFVLPFVLLVASTSTVALILAFRCMSQISRS